MEYLTKCGCYEQEDLFDAMFQGMKAKVEVMRLYPEMTAFVLKAYYEKDEEVKGEVQKLIEHYGGFRANAYLVNLAPEKFRQGLDLECTSICSGPAKGIFGRKCKRGTLRWMTWSGTLPGCSNSGRRYI